MDVDVIPTVACGIPVDCYSRTWRTQGKLTSSNLLTVTRPRVVSLESPSRCSQLCKTQGSKIVDSNLSSSNISDLDIVRCRPCVLGLQFPAYSWVVASEAALSSRAVCYDLSLLLVMA